MLTSSARLFFVQVTRLLDWRGWIGALLLVNLAGCASTSPVYQSSFRYEQPADKAGQVCVEKAAQKREICEQGCTADYQACLTRIEPLVDVRYGEALKRHAAALDRYRRDLDMYHLQLSMSRHDPVWNGHGYYQPWYGPMYFPPVLPRTPSRDDVLNQVKKEKCDVACGCQTGYDASFLICGGKRIAEEKCVVNCPK